MILSGINACFVQTMADPDHVYLITEAQIPRSMQEAFDMIEPYLPSNQE